MRPRTELVTTHRSFVNTWECDENGHWNVQFYTRAFQQAAEMLAVRTGQANPGARSAICRHIRYHRELHAARSLVVRSGLIGTGPMAGAIVHRLEDNETGMLSATAIDHPGYRLGDLPLADPEEIDDALPRGINAGPHEPADTAALLADETAIESHYSIAADREMGTDGELADEQILSRFTDSAGHIWTHIGFTGEWLAQHGLGRVAVEMKVTRFAPIRSGEPLVLVSWLAERAAKTMLIQHQLNNVGTGKPLAGGLVRALMMDLETRRAVALPDGAGTPSMQGAD